MNFPKFSEAFNASFALLVKLVAHFNSIFREQKAIVSIHLFNHWSIPRFLKSFWISTSSYYAGFSNWARRLLQVISSFSWLCLTTTQKRAIDDFARLELFKIFYYRFSIKHSLRNKHKSSPPLKLRAILFRRKHETRGIAEWIIDVARDCERRIVNKTPYVMHSVSDDWVKLSCTKTGWKIGFETTQFLA